MKTDTTKATADAAEGTLFLGDDWFDPLEAGVRTRIRSFIEELLDFAELLAVIGLANDTNRVAIGYGVPIDDNSDALMWSDGLKAASPNRLHAARMRSSNTAEVTSRHVQDKQGSHGHITRTHPRQNR
jgi:hypothetical protein